MEPQNIMLKEVGNVSLESCRFCLQENVTLTIKRYLGTYNNVMRSLLSMYSLLASYPFTLVTQIPS